MGLLKIWDGKSVNFKTTCSIGDAFGFIHAVKKMNDSIEYSFEPIGGSLSPDELVGYEFELLARNSSN